MVKLSIKLRKNVNSLFKISLQTKMFLILILSHLPVWYKTKFGSQNLATNFGNHLCMTTKIGSQCYF